MLTKYVVAAALLALSGGAHAQGRKPAFFETAVHSKYKPGTYTLADGSRHAASLRIWQDLTHNVLQIDQGKAEPLNLQAAELRGFKISRDSFAVVQKVCMAGAPGEYPFGETAFLKVRLTGAIQVLEHDQLTQAAVSTGMGTQRTLSHFRTWVLQPSASLSPVALPTSQAEFAKHVAPLFVDNPVLCQRIRAGLDGPADFKRIVYAYILKKDIAQVSYEEAAVIFNED